MKIATLLMTAVLATAAHAAVPTADEAALKAKLPEIFAKSAAHYKALDAAATPLMDDGSSGRKRVPHGFSRKAGKLDMRPINWWTTGHYPGSLWYLYEATGDAFFKDRATVWTELLEPNKTDSSHHDTGFIMYCSFGNARRILKTDRYDGILVRTAESLCRRFNPDLGLLRSWGSIGDGKNFLVIPDNMMNLELLTWAGRHGYPRGTEVARAHAANTMKHHFRADGGTYHVLNYDQRPGFHGAVQGIERGQGLSCETAWSRGQSWAIYGYTMMYRETKDPAYLAFAQKVADFAINHPNMPADGVPYWDFGAPGEERDSSAASVMASGLLELASFVPGPTGSAYRAFAVKQLLSLASPAYFSEGDEIGHWLLKHGVGHKPAGTEIDTPLDYGDYYFLEALLRFKALTD
ncbi:MAG: glucuronyl hydrolase [Kiritimatiellia bacterium]